MSGNKVSPSRERCWLSNRVQLLETKVTWSVAVRGTGEWGQTETAVSRPCGTAVNECVSACF